jgi:predicted NBD/HSP70 family sugar kinase
MTFDIGLPLPQRLKETQRHMEEGHPGARKIFETIGVYLGYTVPLYREFYDFDNILVLGRVTSGPGGDVIVQTANSVLEAEFPRLFKQIRIVVPDEKARRVGQSVAAASLPEIKL